MITAALSSYDTVGAVLELLGEQSSALRPTAPDTWQYEAACSAVLSGSNSTDVK